MEQIHIPACIEHRGWFILIHPDSIEIFDCDKVKRDHSATSLGELKSLIDKWENEATEEFNSVDANKDINDDEYYRGLADRTDDDL